MNTFSRLNLLTLLFLGIVLMLVGGTTDVYAQEASLQVTGDTDKVYDVGDRMETVFTATDADHGPVEGADLTITHVGLTDVTISNGGTTDEFGEVVVRGLITSSCVFVRALWPEGGNDGLRAEAWLAGCLDIDIDPSLWVDSSVDDHKLVEVGDEVTVRFFVDPPDEIPLHVSVKNVEVISIWGANDHHAPILPSNYTTNRGGELVVTGVFTGPGDAFIQARWDDPLPHSDILTSTAVFEVRGPLPPTIQVFNKYKETFKHPDVHEHFPDVLRAFKNPEIQNFLNSVVIDRFVRDPKFIRAVYPETDDSILVLLLLDDEFQALFRDAQFHAIVRSSNEIDELVQLILQTTPRPQDTTCPLPLPPPQPELPRATTLGIVSGSNQSGEVGKFLAQSFIVGVLDQNGKPLQGTAVTFGVTAGNGQLSKTIDTTDVYGQARTILTLGSGAGRHSVIARAAGIAQTQTFTATATPPPPPKEPEPVVPVRSSTEDPPMYWIAGNTIYYRPTGGGKEIFNAPQSGTLLTGGLAVDMGGEKIYWTEQTINNMGRIQSADLDGTNIQPVQETIAVPYDIAFDAERRRLYWTTSFGKIQSINVDGTDFRGDFLTGLETPQQIAFDVEKRRLYWTAADGIWSIYTDNDTGIPRRLDKEDLGAVGGIAVFDDVVYWTEQTSSGGRVRSMNRAGLGDKLLAVTESIPAGIAVDPVGGRVYWTTSRGEIQSASLTGAIQTGVMGGDAPAIGIALGGTARVPAGLGAPSLSSVGSVENTLLANYPNPFNPETWIPYQLSASADVSVSIYAVDGHLVRRLDLGHQSAGVYRSQSRAAYWDSRNAFGERVASGLYFYTLTAGDFTATRKMLIRK